MLAVLPTECTKWPVKLLIDLLNCHAQDVSGMTGLVTGIGGKVLQYLELYRFELANSGTQFGEGWHRNSVSAGYFIRMGCYRSRLVLVFNFVFQR